MGQALKRAAQWTSAKDGSGGKLEFTPINEELLNIILGFLEGFSSEHPAESKLVFKKPLIWATILDANYFSGSGYVKRESDVMSESTNSQDKPLFSLYKHDNKTEIAVFNLEYAENVLKAAGEKKLHELRSCLEENRDIMASILGDRFATVDKVDLSLVRFCEEIARDIKQASKTDTGHESSDAKMVMLNLYVNFLQLDDCLLNHSLTKFSKEVRLNPEAVNQEVFLLRAISGVDLENAVLESIEYFGQDDCDYVFKSGCRAPLGRQLHGDICYLTIKPFDADILFVTANTSGYFVNNGPDRKEGILDYTKKSAFYKDLITLLQTKSRTFAEEIEKQEFKVNVEAMKDYAIGASKESVKKLDEPSELGQEADGEQITQPEEDTEARKIETTKKQILEQSSRWKSLEPSEPDIKKYAPKMQRTTLTGKKKPRIVQEIEEHFSESSSESEVEEDVGDRRDHASTDLPSEYWQIQKLVKYLKGGNQTATVIALCSLRDFNLTQETCQLAIKDVGGLEVLINLLDTDDVKCKIGSLKILKDISSNIQIRRTIADLGGLQTMVRILEEKNKELKSLSAETIANVAKFQRARRTVRQHGGIRKLVSLLKSPQITGGNTASKKDLAIARCVALALWSNSKSKNNKESMRKAGAVPLLARLLKSPHENILIPVVGTLQECASEPSYRLAIRTEGMIEDLVRNLRSSNEELQMHSAFAIFKCAEEKETRDLVRHYDGLEPLVDLMSNVENKDLLASVTGAIWKCSISPENVKIFKEHRAIETLVGLLHNQPEGVLVNVVGALGELAKHPPNREQIRKSGGISPLVNLLTGTNQALLKNVTKAVGECAEELDSMSIIDKLDGVRLLWSLLKNPNTEVCSSAAWAVCPCIDNAKDSGELVRSFVGGLELIVNLLKCSDLEVLAGVCAAIANIAKDEENLAVITDHGVVPLLSNLTETTNDKLRQHLAEAIARCCNWGNNRISFGRYNAVAPLVSYLRSQDEKVHRTTSKALFQLSKNPQNCITMYEAGVVKPLMAMVGSTDRVLQEAAAGCIGNIRRLALANEKAVYK